MSKLIDRLFTVIDKTAEAGARKAAVKTGRRSFLAKAGMALAVLALAIPYSLTDVRETAVALLAGALVFSLYVIAEQVMANPAPLLLARKADSLSQPN